MLLTYGPEHITEFVYPSKTFSQLYLYSKWYYNNKSNLGYGIYLRVLLAFSTPYLLRKLLLNSNKQHILKRIKSKIMSFFNGRNNSVASLNHNKTDLQSINFIKQLLVQDIEQVIDIRLNYTFLCNQKSETNLQSISFVKQLLVQEIEQAIDQRLNDIFLNR